MTDSTTKRLNKIESELAHLQYDFEAQNQAILENQKKLVEIENSIKELVRRINSINSKETPRSLEDDKPPHY